MDWVDFHGYMRYQHTTVTTYKSARSIEQQWFKVGSFLYPQLLKDLQPRAGETQAASGHPGFRTRCIHTTKSMYMSTMSTTLYYTMLIDFPLRKQCQLDWINYYLLDDL